MAEPFLGEIRIFGGSYPPRSWALCNGNLLQVSQQSTLFTVIGTAYGGKGYTDFALPDLRGRAPMHHGLGPGLSHRIQGYPVGREQAYMDYRYLPPHNHGVAANPGNADTNTPDNTKVLAKPNYVFKKKVTYQNAYVANTGTPHNQMAGEMVGYTTAGESVMHENRQPFLALVFIIAMEGIFPPRS